MALTFQAILSRLDLRLGEPLPGSPSMPQRLEALRSNVQLIGNTLLNASPNWLTNTFSLIVNSSTDTYLVSAADFGKPVLIETADPSDPYHVPRAVQMMSLQSFPPSEVPMQPDSWGVGGTRHNAQVMMIYRTGGSVYLRVFPKPTTDATYNIFYETTGSDVDALSSVLTLPNAESYLVAQTAFDLLPFCKWSGNDKEENAMQRKEVAAVLLPMVAQFKREWQMYASYDRQAGNTILRGFDDEGAAANWS